MIAGRTAGQGGVAIHVYRKNGKLIEKREKSQCRIKIVAIGHRHQHEDFWTLIEEGHYGRCFWLFPTFIVLTVIVSHEH